jgi:hypothetical protein
MKPGTATMDNITEVLHRIIDYTERRRDVLTRNIFDFRQDNYCPHDLPESEFALRMTEAISEHVRSERLLFCDSDHVRFHGGGDFEIEPVPDSAARDLMHNSISDYLKLQIQKLSENLMNNRIAAELLRHQQQRLSVYPCGNAEKN